jgi:hypothetical protein
MARIVPSHWQALSASGAAQRELDTLARLAAELPDGYTVFHGVHWTRLEQGFALFDDIDFAIVSPGGRLLVIEQVSGFLRESADGLVKHYDQHEKKLAVGVHRSIEALAKRMARAGLDAAGIDVLLYCPDHRVRQPEIAGLDPTRIVDAGRKAELAALIQTVLPLDEPTPLARRVEDFLGQILALVPEIGTIAGQAEALYTRLSGGLATWGRRIDCAPFRLRVIGTAGSGKSQLALAVCQDAVAAGRHPLYVCFNRPLADHMALLMPAAATVATYHQLCDRVLSGLGERIDFTRPDAFAALEAGFAAATPDAGWQFDELIVDEGQDFRAEWLPLLLRLLKPEGRAWWLEDPLQNLYSRPPLPLPGWVTLRSETNYRSPRDILATLNRLGFVDRPIEAGSPLAGPALEIQSYADAPGLLEATKKALTQALAAGFKRQQIAVLSFRGREHSGLFGLERIGPHVLRTFSGRYDLLGNPEYTAGEILLETVYRFKGQAAPYVVFTEIDFAELDERTARKLFVGATRTSMKLVLVASERAATLLQSRLAAGEPA